MLAKEINLLSQSEAAQKFAELPRIEREMIALRVAKELQVGMCVNLGIGIPTLVSNWTEYLDIVLHAEVGMLKIGPLADPEQEDQDLINASCQPVVEIPGSSCFDIVESFSMIRGGYMDVAVLGALQVSEGGDLSGWINPTRGLGNKGAVGGAMDLAVGAKRLIVAMEHVTSLGEMKILKECTYPLTAKQVVDLIVTDLAVIEVTRDGLVLREVVPGVTPEDVQALTEPTLIISPDIKEMAF